MIAPNPVVSSPWAEVRLRAIIAHVARVSPESFGTDDDLRTTLSLDSLSALRIAAAVEREFEVTIPDNQLHQLTTLRAIIRSLSELPERDVRIDPSCAPGGQVSSEHSGGQNQ